MYAKPFKEVMMVSLIIVVYAACSGAITALTSGQAGLISASEDNTIIIWNVISRTVIGSINVDKGNTMN